MIVYTAVIRTGTSEHDWTDTRLQYKARDFPMAALMAQQRAERRGGQVILVAVDGQGHVS